MEPIFQPKKIYYEPGIVAYPQGRALLEKYADLPRVEIAAHHDIPEFKQAPDEDFAKIKNYLVLGTRKTFRLTPDNKSSDFIVPFTSTGCPALCLYCYLMCRFFKASNLRVFVNREEIVSAIYRQSDKAAEDIVFEIGSNSDMVLENTVTGNLQWFLPAFAAREKDYVTFATKFSAVQPLLGLEHRGRVFFRMSVNPERLIREVELRTSPLSERIRALNLMAEAGYRVGINLAPVMLVENYPALYGELLDRLADELCEKAKKALFFEIIFMTMGKNNLDINAVALPNAPALYDKESFTSRGVGKYCYREGAAAPARSFLIERIEQLFGRRRIKYIV